MASETLNKTCIICGGKYHACHHCEKVVTYTPWRRVCDTFEHYMVYNIIKSYEMEIISKSEAAKQLAELKVTVKSCEDFLPEIAEIVKGILAGEKPAPVIEQKEKIEK